MSTAARRPTQRPSTLTTPAAPGYAPSPHFNSRGHSPMTLDETAIKESPARAIDVCQRIGMMHDFIETIQKDAAEKYVPVSMPPSVGSLGFDTPLWVGLGIVGLWAALDGFAERAKPKKAGMRYLREEELHPVKVRLLHPRRRRKGPSRIGRPASSLRPQLRW
jgi:hypothetical protein